MGALRIFILVTILSLGLCSKYSKEKNLSERERPFRMNKVNLIWEKAKKRVTGPKLAELYADLTVQDKVERDLKKLQADDRDKDGLKEAEVRQRLLGILETYDLQNVFPTLSPLPDRSENEIPGESIPNTVKDKKLQKLWKKAEFAGFSEQEMEELKQEFWHQQMKLDEFNNLKDELETFDDYMDNSLDPEMRKNKIKKKQHLDLKVMHKDLKSGYDKLEAILDSNRGNDVEFNDHRVYELWALAKKANMSEAELESFKRELKHFENRIQKHEYYEEQLHQSAELMKENDEMTDRHKQLIQTVSDNEKKVQKYHTHLRSRIDKVFQHAEL